MRSPPEGHHDGPLCRLWPLFLLGGGCGAPIGVNLPPRQARIHSSPDVGCCCGIGLYGTDVETAAVCGGGAVAPRH